MNHLRRRILLTSFASTSLLISQGCATYSESIKDGESLASDEGLLLVFANLQWLGTSREDHPPLELTYRPITSTFDLRRIHFFKRERMHLLRIKAGDYLMTHSFFGFSQLDFPRPIPFAIRSSTISYIGHFEGEVTWPKVGLISDRQLQILDKENVARKSMISINSGFSSKLNFVNLTTPGFLRKFSS